MKKFGLFLIGAVAAIILLSQLGPLIGLVISGAILYLVFKQFLKSSTTWEKVLWGIAGVVMLGITASHLPAILGLAAAYILYVVFKKWNNASGTSKKDNDPFANFEKQWAELNKN
ncbi:lmo0954 family membrane protein [Niallia sp. 01092]|uniref:lmo0954 family membrane protein n=1 Tax=unclassified Niallia TaxID=2837522 RepID=UPI003FD2C0C8